MAQKSTTGRTVLLSSLRATFAAANLISPELAAVGAARLFMKTRRYPLGERERAPLQEARRSEIASPWGPLAVWSWGDRSAPAVALVHGWEGRASQLGAFAGPLVESGFRVIGIDAPGHGESPGRSSSLVALARALHLLGDHHGPFAGVIAHSAGAAAATYALAHGLAADRIVCVAPGVDLDGFARDFARVLGLPPEVRVRMRRRIERLVGVNWDDLDPCRAAENLRIPLLVIHDRADRETPFAGGEALVRSWPGARLITTEGLGHRRILWKEEVVAATTDFLCEAQREQSVLRASLTSA